MREHVDELLMLIVAMIFGFSYSVQSMGAQYVGPFSFSAIKYIISFVLLLVIYLARKRKNSNLSEAVKYGLIIAIILTVFSYLQQVVALENTPGKTGFITSMYIVEVPVVNFIVFKKKINMQTLLSLLIALAGLVLLCDLSNFTIKTSDLLTIVCSFILCTQIVIVGKCCGDIDAIELNLCISFFVMIFSLIGAITFNEGLNIEGYKAAIIPLLYVGVFASAVGVSLQAYAQKTLDETTTSLILSLESLFSVFAGYLILDTTLSKMELIGCMLMFIAVIMCVTADKNKKS